MLSYRKANHFIDAAKLLFKVGIFHGFLSTHIKTAGKRNLNIDLSTYHLAVNRIIPLSLVAFPTIHLNSASPSTFARKCARYGVLPQDVLFNFWSDLGTA